MAAADCTIRPMTADDVPEALAIWEEMAAQHAAYDGERWNWAEGASEHMRRHLEEILGEADHVCLVAVGQGARVVGFTNGSVQETAPVFAAGPAADIANVGVAKEHRRKGVGTALTRALLQELRNLGAEEVRLSVAIGNAPAVAMYEKIGLRGVMTAMYTRLT
jgi:ribosomal protein S18 acetylase RimI-like enzyme